MILCDASRCPVCPPGVGTGIHLQLWLPACPGPAGTGYLALASCWSWGEMWGKHWNSSSLNKNKKCDSEHFPHLGTVSLMKWDSQFDAMLNDVLLLFYNLILLWMICLGNWDAGWDCGVQWADAVSTSCQLLWQLQLSSLIIRRMLLAWKQITKKNNNYFWVDFLLTSALLTYYLTLHTHPGWPEGLDWHTCLCSTPPYIWGWTPDTPNPFYEGSAPVDCIKHTCKWFTHKTCLGSSVKEGPPPTTSQLCAYNVLNRL